MYRGRPPPRGEYPPPYDGRGPPPHASHPGPGRPFTRPPFRGDRGRPRPPVHHGYQDHGPPDPYRRSPPRRRYPSPGPGSDRRPGSEYWGSGPPRDRSPSLPLGGIPMDHSLVITVGNERTRPGLGPPQNPMPYNRDYPPRHADGPDDRGPRRRSPSRGRSRPRSHSRSPDRSRARSRARSKSRPKSRSRSPSPARSRARSSARSKSRPRSQSHSPERGRARSIARSKSRPRSHSRSPERGRAKSRARSKSRPRSQSHSPERGRARSIARSKSRPRSHSRSPDRSRAKSRARSKSRPRSRSRSRSPEQSRGQAQSRGRSVGRVKSRSRSVSTSSTSSSSRSPSVAKKPDEFKELQMARRRKEIEQMNRPTKSILKKHPDSEDSPSLNIDSPRNPVESANVSREAERFLTAVKGMEPNMLASLLAELKEDSQMAQSAGLNPATLSLILGLLGGMAGRQQDNRQQADVEDEEKFLYGDDDEPPERSRALTEVPQQHSLSEIYGDTEAAPYDLTPHYDTVKKAHSAPVVAPPHSLGHAGSGEHTPRGHQQVDMRYHSRSITPDRNIKAETPKLEYPPGTGPLDEKEKHEVEEYEKIQDLLKTIGLDLGVTEISKMAARTQERLHGKKPPPKTPTRRPGKRSRRDSSGSSGSSRHGRGRSSHSLSGSRSSGSSSSRSRSRSRNWSSGPENKSRNKSSPSDRRSVHVKSKSSREVKNEVSDRGLPVPGKVMSQSADPKAPAGHPALAMPAYPQAQPHGLVAPNYPPPGYGQYGNYMPYMPQQWPMYPPPSMGVPPPSPNEDYQNVPASPFDRPYLKVVQTTESGVKGNGRAIPRTGSSYQRRCSEEKNNENEKQKVLEEREKLRKERDVRMKKKEYLMKELETLRKQQGELLRTKRREKDGHKDPLLTEISRLQEEVMSQISVLRKEHETAEKKRSEIDKVALILGLSASDKPRKVSRASGDQEQPPPAEKDKKKKQDRSPEKSPVVKSSSSKVVSSSRASSDKLQNVPGGAPTPVMAIDPFEYYDAGNHWCQHCNVTSGSMFDFFTHLHSKSHRKTQDPYSRPWASSSTKNEKNHSSEEKMSKPAKGSEFLLPVRGFYCQLCEEFYGDAICAEEHVTSHSHNEKYKKQMYENPLYEQRRNLDRQAGLGGKKYSGLKRKHEDESRDSKEKEEKSKHSKKDEDKSKSKKKKEEEQKAEKAKPSNKEEEKTNYSKKEQERPKSSKKEEEERSLYSKREGEEKYKSSKKEEPEGYKYGKKEERYPYRREEEDGHKYRREEEDRSRYGKVDERYKHSGRNVEDEERSRYSKGKEPKPKYDRKEEAKNKSEREEGKNRMSNKDNAGRPKEENPRSTKQLEKSSEKINEPPKIICGPSPAMRAKLRKKSEEATKGVANAPPVLGKFSWKKKENQLAKEAERVAAEFLKEEEAKASERNDDEEDAYSKSVAMAKNIAIKLSGKTGIPQHVSGRIHHITPYAPVRPKWVYCKPDHLNTFLSIGEPSTGSVTPLPVTPLPVTPLPVTPLLVAQSPSPKDCLQSPDIISKAIGGQEVVFKKPDLPVLSSSPGKVKPTEAKPATTMSMMESDVAAPGVPECEQNRPVQVQPPPYMAKYPSEVVHKSEKKSNLANLFDILYSSSTPSSTSTANKPAEICKGGANNSKPSDSLPSVAPETMQSQSQPQLQIKAQPQTQHQTEPGPQHQTKPLPQPQTELQSKLQPQPLPESQPQNKPQSEPEAQPQPQPQLLVQHQSQPQLAADPEKSTSPDIHIQDPTESESEVGSEPLSSEVNPDDASSANIMEIPTDTMDLPTVVLSSPQPHLHPDPEKGTSAEIDIQDPTESESGAGSETLPCEVNPDDASAANIMEIPTETLDLPAAVLTSPHPQPHLCPDPENNTSADTDIQDPTESESEVASEPLTSGVNPDDASSANIMEIPTETLDLPAEVLTPPQLQPHLLPDFENSTSAPIDLQDPTESESEVGSETLPSEVNPNDALSANAMEIPTETFDLPTEVPTSPQPQPHLSPDPENSTSADIDIQDPTESESEVGSEPLSSEVNPDDASSDNIMDTPTDTLDLPPEVLTSPHPQTHLSPDPENSTSAENDIQEPESESEFGSEPLSSEVNPDEASSANIMGIPTDTLDLPPEELTSPQPHFSPDHVNNTTADIDIQDPTESESEVGSETHSSEVNPDDASSANIMEIPTDTLDLPAEVLTSPQPQPYRAPDLENSMSAEIDIQNPTECASGVGSETLPSEVNPDDASAANTMEIPTETLDLPAEVLTLDFDYDFNFE